MIAITTSNSIKVNPRRAVFISFTQVGVLGGTGYLGSKLDISIPVDADRGNHGQAEQ